MSEEDRPKQEPEYEDLKREYPKLTVEQILTRALALSPDQIDQVVDFERHHQNRKVVVEGLKQAA